MDKPIFDPAIAKVIDDYTAAYDNLMKQRIPFKEFAHIVQVLLSDARNLPIVTNAFDINDPRARMRSRLALNALSLIAEDVQVVVSVWAIGNKPNN